MIRCLKVVYIDLQSLFSSRDFIAFTLCSESDKQFYVLIGFDRFGFTL